MFRINAFLIQGGSKVDYKLQDMKCSIKFRRYNLPNLRWYLFHCTWWNAIFIISTWYCNKYFSIIICFYNLTCSLKINRHSSFNRLFVLFRTTVMPIGTLIFELEEYYKLFCMLGFNYFVYFLFILVCENWRLSASIAFLCVVPGVRNIL